MLQCVRLAAERRSLKMCSYRSRVVQKSGGIFSDKIITNVIPIPTVKKHLKIGQYLTKLGRTKQIVSVFFVPLRDSRYEQQATPVTVWLRRETAWPTESQPMKSGPRPDDRGSVTITT